jgi:hypothetical protein
MGVMRSVRGKLPEDSFDALVTLIRVLGSGELSRGLFDGERPPRARLPRKAVKKARPRKPKSLRG